MERTKEGTGVDSDEGLTEGGADGDSSGTSMPSVGDDVALTDSEGIWDGLRVERRDEGLLDSREEGDGVGTSKRIN